MLFNGFYSKWNADKTDEADNREFYDLNKIMNNSTIFNKKI